MGQDDVDLHHPWGEKKKVQAAIPGKSVLLADVRTFASDKAKLRDISHEISTIMEKEILEPAFGAEAEMAGANKRRCKSSRRAEAIACSVTSL